VPLFFGDSVRRFVGLAVILFFSIPFGLSVTGCGHKTAAAQYCNAGDSGPVVGQVASITLSPSLATIGESLNFAQIGTGLNASAIDCKGNAVSVKSYVYASTSSFNVNTPGGPIFADINPANGQVCGGTWNRNTGGGVLDYTICTAPTSTPNAYLAYVTATANGAVSNAIPVYVHPIVTGIVLGGATPGVVNGSCPVSTDASGSITVLGTSSATVTVNGVTFSLVPESTADLTAVNLLSQLQASTNAAITELNFSLGTGATITVTAKVPGTTANAYTLATSNPSDITVSGATLTGGTAGTPDPGTDCCPNSTVGTPIVAPVYTGTSCVSQNVHAQFVARVYANGTVTPANNITCQVGHLSYSAVNGSSIVTIDQNGVATANQPGSTEITATLANSSSSTQAGFFSTCPPASISLAIPTSSATSISVNLNNIQPFTATVLDTNNLPITGLNLEYNSTAPQNIPAGSGSVTPAYPGSAVITAVCQPATCNVANFSQIGLFGNGLPLTSNGITVTTPGTSSTVLYMASAADTRTGSPGSQYIVPYDFTINQPNSPIKLAYVPNSMVMNLAGTTLYLGSPQGLMTLTTSNNAATTPNQNVPGTVLSVSPDGTQIVVTDPIRQTISLISSSLAVETTYEGVGTSAVWTPDSQTVYVTTQDGPATTSNPNPSYTTPTLLQYTLFTKWQPIVTDEVYTSAVITVPSVGAFFSGAATTDGRSYCPSGTITSAGPPPVVVNTFAPLAKDPAVPNDLEDRPVINDQLAATSDGIHILGAHAVGANSVLNDLQVVLPITESCPQPGGPVPTFSSTPFSRALTGVTATSITGVFPSTNSVVAPITYIGTGSVLPVYYPAPSGLGNLVDVKLSGTATAPLSGVFSTDSFTFYAGTATDNEVHLITFTYPTGGGAPTATDSSQLTPNLPAYGGTGSTYAPVNLLAQYPKKAKS
jgi:hypothetical protein